LKRRPIKVVNKGYFIHLKWQPKNGGGIFVDPIPNTGLNQFGFIPNGSI